MTEIEKLKKLAEYNFQDSIANLFAVQGLFNIGDTTAEGLMLMSESVERMANSFAIGCVLEKYLDKKE